MAEPTEKKSFIAKVASIIAVVSGILGIFVTIRACYTNPPLPPISHEIDGYWSSSPGDHMRVLYLDVNSDRTISGKLSEPCIPSSQLTELDKFNPTREYAIDSGGTWDGKNLQFDWAYRAYTFKGILVNDKITGVNKTHSIDVQLSADKKVKTPEFNDNLEFTRGKRGCVTSLDVRTDTQADIDQDYPLAGYWHSANAQLHIIEVKPDGKVIMTESYPCMDTAKGTHIDETTTHWDGKILKFLLPPIVAPTWKIGGNELYAFTVQKIHGRLTGTMVSKSQSSRVVYERGKIVCDSN